MPQPTGSVAKILRPAVGLRARNADGGTTKCPHTFQCFWVATICARSTDDPGRSLAIFREHPGAAELRAATADAPARDRRAGAAARYRGRGVGRAAGGQRFAAYH